jgi:hypothetical protein
MIARNVFFGVFRRNFPAEFIAEANILVLEHSFIRTGTNVTYILRDYLYKDRYGKDRTFVNVLATLRFKLRNIANVARPFELKVGLPNPMIDELKDYCRVLKVKVNNYYDVPHGDISAYLDSAMPAAQQKFRDLLTDDSHFMVPFHVATLNIKPDQEIEVIYEYEMAKEEEDTEICQTLYPMDSVNITIVDRGPTQRIVRAKSIHHANLEDDTSANETGTYNYRLDRYLLPHQGYAIWWKKVPVPPDATTQDVPLIEIQPGNDR